MDLNGEYPGQLFDTMDEAAKDFAYFINSKSIQNNREYSTSFYIREYTFTVTHYRYKKIMGVSVPVPYTVTWHLRGYTYTDPVAGDVLTSPVPNKSGQLGIGHSHGAYKPQKPDELKYHNDSFSDRDIRVANSFLSPTVSYLITPAGILRKYDPQTQVDEEIFPTENFPYDPKHPARRKANSNY